MNRTLRPISADEARRILAAAGRVTERVTVGLQDANGRVLAGAFVATEELPAFPRSLMDGYAVRAADLAAANSSAPVLLRLGGAIAVGTTPDRALAPGEAFSIPTGGH